MSAHHPFGPSTLPRRYLCPGSYQLEQELGDRLHEEETEYAASGKRIHAAMQLSMADLLKGDRAGCNEEEKELVLKCAQFAQEFAGWCGADRFHERQFELDLGNRQTIHGTADYLEVYWTETENKAVLIDWKTGWKELHTDSISIQLQAYAAMVFQAYPSVETIDCYVYAPRADDSYHLTINRIKLDGIIDLVSAIIKRCQPNPPEYTPQLNPSAAACTYCPCKPHCPALQGQTFELAERPPQLPMDMRERAELFEKAQLGIKALESLVSEIKRAAIHDAQVPEGYEVFQKRGKAKIEDPSVLYRLLEKHADTQDKPTEVPTPEEFIREGSWSLKAVRELFGISDAKLKEIGADAIKQGDPYPTMRKAKS